MAEYVYRKVLTEKKRYDVVVCGGGVAGCAAAYAAAKRGRSVLLLEKTNILGGLGTTGRINLFVPMCNGRGKQIIFGLAEKWLRESALYGYDTIPSAWRDGEPKEYTEKRYTQRYSPYIFAFQLLEDVMRTGVDVLYDCTAVEAVVDEETGKRCCGVVTDSKSGLELYGCQMLIDTTGEMDVLRRMGVPSVAGRNYFTYGVSTVTLEGCRKALESGDIRKVYSSAKGGGINLFGDGQPEDVPRWSGLTAEEVTDYLVTNQLLVLERMKETAGERTARDVAAIPMMPQFRTTCRLKGDYTLRVSDAYRHFDDSICAINDFEHRDHLFEVPLRTVTRRDYPNVLTAGRSASGEGYGWDLLRVIPPAILTGQAAGEAACLALETGVGAADVDIRTLQERLEGENVMIHFPDEYVPEDRTVEIHGKNAAEIEGGHL